MIGQIISYYKILAKLGEGGMGVVYKAEDNKLKRIVALKFLSAIALGAEDKSRFLREAQAAAALNHPNICTIHAIDEVDGQMFIAMEFIEGQSLREKIEAGPLKIDEAIKFAMQIADGLQAAHEKGIMHRDIKSANIMITEKGQVKIMDFGLAKLARGGTMLTKEGMTLGTAAYMSPEQARGEVVDHRTDIWSLGVVLYEIISGRLPFRGEYESAMMYSILNEEPEPLTSLRSNVPMDLERVVAKMLAKNPAARYQHVDELPVDLKTITTTSVGRSKISTKPVQPGTVTKISASRIRLPWMIATIISSLVALALAIIQFRAERPEVQTIRSFIRLPERETFVYRSASVPEVPALSLDDNKLAFVDADFAGNTRLWVRSLDALMALPLQGTEGANYPFWSPDNQSIGFFAAGKLKKVDIAGGPPLTICDASYGRGGTWNKDEIIVFTPTAYDVLYQVSAAGGAPTAVTKFDTTTGENSHRWPQFLPDGKHVLYFARTSMPGGSIYVASLDGKTNKRLAAAHSNVAYANGYLLFLREQSLMAQPFNTSALELTGEAVAIADRVRYSELFSIGIFSVSENGLLVYDGGRMPVGYQVAWFDRTGKHLTTLRELTEVSWCRLSPDGQKIVLNETDPKSLNSDIWVYDVKHEIKTRLTFDPAREAFSIWSPDGSRIVFESGRKGKSDLYQKSVSGAGAEELLFESNLYKFPMDWSWDGRFIVYAGVGSRTQLDLWILPLTGDRGSTPFLQTEFNEVYGRFSPNGSWIAYFSNESGRYEIYVRPFLVPAGQPTGNLASKWQVSTTGGNFPCWKGDGKELYFVSGDGKVMAAEVNGAGATFEVGAVRPLFDMRSKGLTGLLYDVSRDGQRFLMQLNPIGESSADVTLVTNWDKELKKQ